jgi:hypothetical protein
MDQQVVYYAAAIGAQIETRRERDKSVLTLSAGGIGLLVTLATTVGIASPEVGVLYLIAIVFYLAAIVSQLWMFSREEYYIARVLSRLRPEGEGRASGPVPRTDLLPLALFVLGVLFAVGAGAAQGLSEVNTRSPRLGSTRDSGGVSEVAIPDVKASSRRPSGVEGRKPLLDVPMCLAPSKD